MAIFLLSGADEEIAGEIPNLQGYFLCYAIRSLNRRINPRDGVSALICPVQLRLVTLRLELSGTRIQL